MRGTLRRKSDDSFQYRIYRGLDQDGHQLFDYHTIYARTQREAEAAATRLLYALDNGTYCEPSRLTVAEYMTTWLEDYAAHNVSPYTLSRYRSLVNRHLIPALGSIRLNQLTASRIERYYASELSSGRLNRKRDGEETGSAQGLDPQTVLKHHRVLRTALKRAVRLGLISNNPCDNVEPPRAARSEMQVLDERDTERLLAVAYETRPLSLYAAVLLAANTGLRRGEVLGLRWSDIDFGAATLNVNRSLQRSDDGITFGSPKTTASRRRLMLDAHTLSEMKAYKARQTKERLALGGLWQDNDLVCPGHRGEPWHPNMLTRDFAKLRKRCGFSLRFHDLRHTHAAQLIRAGAQAKVIQERLGHSSAGFTLTVYGHLLPGIQDEAVARLGEARAAARRGLAASE